MHVYFQQNSCQKRTVSLLSLNFFPPERNLVERGDLSRIKTNGHELHKSFLLSLLATEWIWPVVHVFVKQDGSVLQIALFLKYLSAAIKFDLQTFSGSREAAMEQPRTSRIWI